MYILWVSTTLLPIHLYPRIVWDSLSWLCCLQRPGRKVLLLLKGTCFIDRHFFPTRVVGVLNLRVTCSLNPTRWFLGAFSHPVPITNHHQNYCSFSRESIQKTLAWPGSCWAMQASKLWQAHHIGRHGGPRGQRAEMFPLQSNLGTCEASTELPRWFFPRCSDSPPWLYTHRAF